MALPASDAFNRADSTSLGSNWIQQLQGGCQILSTGAVAHDRVSGVDQFVMWTADTFAADHYSEITIGVSTGNFVGPTVRASGTSTGANLYYARLRDQTFGFSEIDIWANGGFSVQLGASFQVTFTVGDVFRLDATGSTLTLTQNSSFVTSRVDTTFTSGSAGFGIFLSGVVSAWGADNVGSTGGSTGGGTGSTATLGSGFLMMGMQ